MKYFCRAAALFFLVLFCGAFGLSYLNASPMQGQVEFNIRFFDRRIYYVQTDPIFVQFTITNNSPAVYRFRLADERAFSVDFDVRTMNNRQLQQADTLIRRRTQNTQVFFREIAIESGESFSFVEDLRDYINFTQPGSFRVRAMLYPELFRTAVLGAPFTPVIESNFLTLTLRPPALYGPDGIPLQMDIATGAVLVRQRLPPDEVVEFMITARQQSHWERFFLYLDLEAMLQRDPIQRRRFMNENEAGRQRMIAEYRLNLQNAVIDGDIVVIPTSFEILRTLHNNFEATVTVLQRFRMTTFTELREYTYYLERRDNIWIIVNYSLRAMGTTAND